MKTGWVLAGAFAAVVGTGFLFSAPRADETEAVKETVKDDDIVVVIGTEPTEGRPVLPATETEFKLKLKDTGDVLAFRWEQLEINERRRVQKLYGLEVVDNRVKMGNKLTGVRYSFDGGKTLEGLLVPERCRSGQKAIRTATTPLMMINERDIIKQEPIECYESDFFSAREIYDRLILEKPPGKDDAAAHLEYARTAGNMGLYKEALDHLTIAEIIDPRTKERNSADRMQLIKEHAEKEAQKQYDLLLKYRRANEFFAALDVLDKLDRSFPNSELKSRWDSLRSEIVEGSKAELNKKVIQMSYGIVSDLIQQKFYKKVKVDEKGNLVPSIPGKQVTTRHGHIFRGTIVNPDSNGDLVVKVGETTVTIRGKDIMSVQDVDLSVGAKEIAATYDDLKQFVTDVGGQGGLKAAMIARIAQLVKQPEPKIREIFDTRLSREAVYEDGQYKASPVYTTLHDAGYGKGSWLRDGSRPLPAPTFVNPSRGTGRTAQQGPPPEETNPDATDDPAIWWKFQNSETQLAILRAFAAEKVFSVKQVVNIGCKECGAKGVIQVTGVGGKTIDIRCPACRGISVYFKILYQ